MECDSKDQIRIRLGAEVFCNNKRLGCLPVRDFQVEKKTASSGEGHLEVKDTEGMENTIVQAIWQSFEQLVTPALVNPPLYLQAPDDGLSGDNVDNVFPTAKHHMPLADKKTGCQHCALSKTCLISRLDDACQEVIREIVRYPKPLHKGDRLFMSGDRFSALYLIKAGSFKSTLIDGEGNAQVTGFHFASDLLGLDGMRSGQHIYEVEALETSSVCSLPFNFAQYLSSEGMRAFYPLLMSQMTTNVLNDSSLFLVLSRMHAEQRLASFLLDFSQKARDSGKSGYEFTLTMPRYDIANYLGLAGETVSRLFQRLEKEGIVVCQRHSVFILDMARLEQIKNQGLRLSRGKHSTCETATSH